MYDIYVGKRVSLLFRWGSLWIGGHWSPDKRQWCVNLIPCLTIRIKVPKKETPDPYALGGEIHRRLEASLTPHMCTECRINYVYANGLCRDCAKDYV